MALLAEELVEEWLNRQGYFTIRGIKTGVHEIDILAVRHVSGRLECRHLAVQASMRLVSYITRAPAVATMRRCRSRSHPRASGLGAVSAKFNCCLSAIRSDSHRSLYRVIVSHRRLPSLNVGVTIPSGRRQEAKTLPEGDRG